MAECQQLIPRLLCCFPLLVFAQASQVGDESGTFVPREQWQASLMATPQPCISCGQNAPIVLRGVDAFCTVCGARRTPFAADIVNIAGKPARLGGHAARAFGWGFLVLGLFLALTIGLVVQAIASMFVATTWLGLAFGVPIALLSIGVAVLAIMGGRKLLHAGERRLRKAQVEAVHGLARHQRGVVKAGDVARALSLDDEEADALLVTLAKDPSEEVSIDIDDDGRVSYLFGSAQAIRWRIRAEQSDLPNADRQALEREPQPIEDDELAARGAHGRAQRR
jgi:hypothetical protein